MALHLQIIGDALLERHGQVGVTDESRRAGAVHAVGLDRLDRRFLDRRMRGHAQIVLRGEVHAIDGIATVVGGGTHSTRACFGGAGKGPQTVHATVVLPGEERVTALGEVGTALDAKIAHAAAECAIDLAVENIFRHDLALFPEVVFVFAFLAGPDFAFRF